MISYVKTQWFKLLAAIICLGVSIYYAFQPGAETLTVETLSETTSAMFTAASYFFSFIIWITLSFIDFIFDRIALLEKKAEKYDAFCNLVEALRKANDVDREHDKVLDSAIKELRYLVKEELRK